LKRTASSQITGAALLAVGIVIGAGLIFGTLYATGSLSQRTTTVTATSTLVLTTKVTSTPTSGASFGGSNSSFPQLTASPAACGEAGAAAGDAPVGQAAAGHPVACEFNLSNTGSGSAGIPYSECTISVGGSQYSGWLYLTGGARIVSVPGNTSPESAVCDTTEVTGNAVVAPASGSTAGGSITTSSGVIPYSGTWM
jgi:hypothetical protein